MIHSKYKVFTFIIIIIEIVIFLTLSEIIYRGVEYFRGDNESNYRKIYSEFYIRDKFLGWKNKPNAKGIFEVGTCIGTVEFDQNGERIGNNPSNLFLNIPTILVIGDSMVAGFEVDGDKTMAAYMREEFLKHKISVRVINGGVRGYNVLQMKREMERLITIYQPIHVVVLSSGNDVWENVWPQTMFFDEKGYVSGSAYILDESKRYEIRELPTSIQLMTFCGLGVRPLKVKFGDWLYQFQDSIHVLRPIAYRLVNNFNNEFKKKLFSDVYSCGNNEDIEPREEVKKLFDLWEYSLIDLVNVAKKNNVQITLLVSMVNIPLNNRYDKIIKIVSEKTGARHFEIARLYSEIHDPSKKECESDGHYVAYEHHLIAQLINDDIMESVKGCLVDKSNINEE